MNLEKTSLFLGHEEAENALTQAIRSGKVFPTWIFCGPFGVGKSTLAHRFAKCLLSETIPSGGQLECKDEKVSRMVDLRTHPDFFVLEQREENVSIDETRELVSKILKTPSMSKWRVMILENASNLNKNICNSLLKILEEPPKNSVVMLICENISLLPRTLVSRSSVLNIGALKTEQVTEILRLKGIDNSEQLARLSNGSVGYALYFLENNGMEIYEKLLEAFDFSGKQPNYQKSLKYLMDNDYVGNFRIIKESLLRILKIYADLLNEVAENCSNREREILMSNIRGRNLNVDEELQKILEIIQMIGKGETMMLDKKSVLLYVFEKFFEK